MPASAVATYPDERYGHITIFVILCAILLTILFRLPQTIARFASENAATQGWILRYTAPKTRSPLLRQPTRKVARGGAETPSTRVEAASLKRSASRMERIAEYNRQKPRLAPIHIASWSTFLSPFSQLFSARVLGYSVGQVAVLAAYAALIGIAMLILCNPVTNVKRAGWIATSQYPVAFALGSKNSIVGLLVGQGYERLNYIHRWVGQLMFIATLFHVVGYLVIWTKAGTITTHMTRMSAVCGIVALGGMSLLAICSHPAIRRRSYGLFWNCHWVGFTTMLIATAYHMPSTIPYTLASVGIFALDALVKLIKSHYAVATIEYIPELSTTRVTIPTLSSGWRAGQHVRLTVVSTEMGMTNVLESHPFTIASPSDDEDGLVLLVKSAGDWTKKLGSLARGGSSSNGEKGFGAGRNVNVIVQGPYGGPGNTMFSSYSAAMIVCGGSGISFGLAAVQEILRDSFDRASRVRLVDLVWTVQDPASIVPLLSILTKISEQASAITSLSLRISIHYTRAASMVPDYSLSADNNVTVTAGRPDLSDVLYGSLSCVSALRKTNKGRGSGVNGVLMVVCGPDGLVKGVRAAERAVGTEVRRAVGGVELVEEVFGW